MSSSKYFVLGLLTVLSSLVMLWKLDAPFFFTDEILYVDAGQEYKRSDYTLNLQHPLLGKYLSALTSGTNETNVFLLRLPFALVGIISGLLVFLIIKNEAGFWWGIVGNLVYLSMPFIIQTNRAVLLEAPMHFFWLVVSWWVLNYFRYGSKKYLYLAGVALGLAMSVKYTSIILVPAFILRKKYGINYKDYLITGLLALSAFILHYSHLIIYTGIDGLIHTVQVFKDVILTRNSEGKTHVINGRIYDKSPWWFYVFYFDKYFGRLREAIIIPTSLLSIKSATSYTHYWLVMFLTALIYFQLLSLKNSRYIASLEVPLVFLLVLGMKVIYQKMGKLPVIIIVSLLITPAIITTYLRQPESYHAAYNELALETANFSNGERVLIFGSTRTSRWYFKGPEDIIVIRKDLVPLASEFGNFNYILVDTAERLKYPDNVLFPYLDDFSTNYEIQKYDEVWLYKRIDR